jgi:uroporphyrinogen decarboxylase
MLAAREAKLTQAQFREHPDLAAKAFIQSVEKYDLDGILVDLDTATLAGAVGVPVALPDDSPAVCHGGCLPTLEAVRDLAPVELSNCRYVNHWLEIVRQLRAYFGDEIFIRGNCDQAPFTLACMMRTPGEFMMDLCDSDNREPVTRLLEYCTGITCQFIRLMAQAGAHMVSNGDSSAGPAMISPAMFVDFALPAEKAVIAVSHAESLPYTLHICGDTSLILEQIARTGTDAVELDYKTSLDAAHAVLKDSVTFIGNIDPSGVLARSTASKVRTAVQHLLEVFADTPRFILNAGCAIPPTAPEENIRAMLETARAFR